MEEIKIEPRKTFEPTQAIGLIIGGYDTKTRQQLEKFFKFLGIRDIR